MRGNYGAKNHLEHVFSGRDDSDTSFIEDELRRRFQSVVEEPLPPDLLTVLSRLETAEAAADSPSGADG